jgi:RNA polymerase sigma factor (sigma-70 family)
MVESRLALIERLFAEHAGSLRAFFQRRTRHSPDAADLAQEVYLRMLRIPDISAIQNVEAYLYTVASNLVREQGSASRKLGGADIDDPLIQLQIADLPAFGAHIDSERSVARLREVLRQLPPKCQAAVELQYWHGLSYAEIALRLGISTHMVKKYLGQALVHCRRRMARLG